MIWGGGGPSRSVASVARSCSAFLFPFLFFSFSFSFLFFFPFFSHPFTSPFPSPLPEEMNSTETGDGEKKERPRVGWLGGCVGEYTHWRCGMFRLGCSLFHYFSLFCLLQALGIAVFGMGWAWVSAHSHTCVSVCIFMRVSVQHARRGHGISIVRAADRGGDDCRCQHLAYQHETYIPRASRHMPILGIGLRYEQDLWKCLFSDIRTGHPAPGEGAQKGHDRRLPCSARLGRLTFPNLNSAMMRSRRVSGFQTT